MSQAESTEKMAAENPAGKVKWSSRSTFLMAAIGAAVGLGNIWRFPYITGENGGGAFVLLYILFVFIIGFPLIMAELALGRAGKKSAIGTMQDMIRQGHSPLWKIIGILSLLVPLMGLMYYSVVAGWSLDYIFQALKGSFQNIDAQQSGALFGELQQSWPRLTFWHSLYMVGIIIMVSLGLRGGLEKTVKFMMPSLFFILVGLATYAMITGDGLKTLSFLFRPDFSKITGDVVLMAMGQAMFSLAIGTGAMITYGAYLPRDIKLPRVAKIIALSDTLVAMLAGLMIFPIVFQYGLAPQGGPGLIFTTLPIAFGQMPGGMVFAIFFFILLSLAAFTSSIAMLEPAISWFEDKGLSRVKMAWVTGGIAWAVGVTIALSSNILAHVRPLGLIPVFADKNLFDTMDYLVANVMLPLNALLLSLFVGWVMSRATLSDQLDLPLKKMPYQLWQFAVRFLAPVAIMIILYLKITAI